MSELAGSLEGMPDSFLHHPPYAGAFCWHTCDDITPETVNHIIAMTEDLFT